MQDIAGDTIMITIHIQPEDIADMRFGYSPLIDLVLSYRVYKRPYPAFQWWVDAVHEQLVGVPLPYMDAIITPSFGASFSVPVPDGSSRHIADDLDTLRQTTDAAIRQQLQWILTIEPLTPARQHFMDAPREALECLIREMGYYWDIALAPFWRQMMGVLENEILYRAKRFALDGAEQALDELGHNGTFTDGILTIEKTHFPFLPSDYKLGGRGFQLVPTIFKGHVGSHIRPDKRPLLMYGARATGLLQIENDVEPDESLQLLVGAARARVLNALHKPRHTQELARVLSLSASAVSQHLRRLQQAGMVESHRSGYYVYYRLTHRGEQLLELFER
jgi:DNA-binding transcriptional ArsR family regulator